MIYELWILGINGWDFGLILVQEGLVLAGLENGFVVHYLSDVLLGEHHLRTQFDAAFGGILVVDQFVHVAVFDEAEVLFRLLVLEEVDPQRRALDQFRLRADHLGDKLLVEGILGVAPLATSGQIDWPLSRNQWTKGTDGLLLLLDDLQLKLVLDRRPGIAGFLNEGTSTSLGGFLRSLWRDRVSQRDMTRLVRFVWGEGKGSLEWAEEPPKKRISRLQATLFRDSRGLTGN